MNHKRRIIGVAFLAALVCAFFVPLAGLRADTSYLLIQGGFGAGGATETYKWQVDYPTGALQSGLDLLSTVFGTPSPAGTYTNAFGEIYPYWVAGNSTLGAAYIDYGTDPSQLTEPFLVSVTVDSVTLTQATDYSPGWVYYVGNGAGAWTVATVGVETRELSNGSYDGWVFGATNPYGSPVTFVTGSTNTPTTANFSNAMIVDLTPEPTSAVMLVLGTGGLLGLSRRRRP